MIVILTKYQSDDHIKKNEMDGACSTYWGKKMCVQVFDGET